MENETSDKSLKIKVPKLSTRKKFFRKREDSLEDDNEVDEGTKSVSVLQETKELQKLRKRQNGVSAMALALGKKITLEEETLVNDPFRVNAGGMMDMKVLMSGKLKKVDDAYDTGIGTQFSAETNQRDEDAEMMKYIEEELSKRKGTLSDDVSVNVIKHLSPEEVALLAIPEALRKSSSKKSEEMLSNQMLSGIPEVDLGIEAKIHNIEATEESKQRLLKERMRKQEGPSQFVPTNMAVNFVQHNRFNIEESDPPKKREQKVQVEKKKPLVVVGSEPSSRISKSREVGEKATDDYHYERFKKQFKRY